MRDMCCFKKNKIYINSTSYCMNFKFDKFHKFYEILQTTYFEYLYDTNVNRIDFINRLFDELASIASIFNIKFF